VAVGTAAAAVPVRSIARLSTNEKYSFALSDSSEGKLVGLSKLMAAIQRGRAEDTEGWCWEITGFPQQGGEEESSSVSLIDTMSEKWPTITSTVSSLHNMVLVGMWNALFLLRG
jgi:hypothetical protein